MKKLIYVSTASIMLLVGCQTTGSEIGLDETDTEVEPDESVDDNQPIETEEPQEEEEEDTQEESGEVQDVDPEYRVNDVLWTVEPIEDADSEIVLATFDDVPDAHTLTIASTLMEHEVPAIFFVNGHFLDTEEEKEALKTLHEMGFEIGNHTMTHPDLKSLSEEEQHEEIVEVNNMVEEIIGERPRFFRAPFGSNTEYASQIVEEEGMVLMNWTYGYDWESNYQDAEALADIMVNSEFLQNGANLLMHDRQWTSDALEDIIEGIRGEGYEFVDPELIE